MMNTSTIIIVIVALALLLYLFKPTKRIVAKGTLAQLKKQFLVLTNGNPKPSALIIHEAKKGDFIQFSCTGSMIELTWPLVTERQKNLESVFRSACSEMNLPIKTSNGTDGAVFLDITLPSNPATLEKAANQLLSKLFGVTKNSVLKYELLQ